MHYDEVAWASSASTDPSHCESTSSASCGPNQVLNPTEGRRDPTLIDIRSIDEFEHFRLGGIVRNQDLQEQVEFLPK